MIGYVKKIIKEWVVDKKKIEERVGFICVFLPLLIMLYLCIRMFCIQVNSQPHTEKWNNYYHYRDSLYSNAINTYSGNSLREMKMRLVFMERQHSNLIADLRQETNSNIDKMNAWLGFWIAILAVLCAIIPILIQYRIYRESRDKQRELHNQLCVLQNQLCVLQSQLQMSEQLYCLRVNFQCSILADSTNRNELTNQLIGSLVLSFRDYKEYIDRPDTLTEERKNKFLVELIRLWEIIDQIIIRPQNRNVRKLYILRDTISKIILILSNGTFSQDKFSKEFSSLILQLNNLPGWLN